MLSILLVIMISILNRNDHNFMSINYSCTVVYVVYINNTMSPRTLSPSPRLELGVVDKVKGAAYGFYTPSQNETG